MKIGDKVRWKSQAAGYTKEKYGEIVKVVAPGQRPTISDVRGAGWGRKHESYVVKVGNKLYWPRVSALEQQP